MFFCEFPSIKNIESYFSNIKNIEIIHIIKNGKCLENISMMDTRQLRIFIKGKQEDVQ